MKIESRVSMVLEFLEKYQEQLISEKMELQEELDLVQTKIKENNKFIQVLDSSDEAFFHDFTPRKINEKNLERLEELNQLRNSLSGEKKNIEDKIQVVNDKLIEIHKVIEVQKAESCKSRKADSAEHIGLDEGRVEHLLELCTQMEYCVFSDAMRCKLLIDEIKEELS